MGKKVLVVEDNPAMVALLADALIDSGLIVISAENGKEGLALVGTEKPDLVILDARRVSRRQRSRLPATRSRHRRETSPPRMISCRRTTCSWATTPTSRATCT